MIVSQQTRREKAAWTVGSIFGLLVGFIAVIYLDRQKTEAPHHNTAVSATTVTQPPAPPLRRPAIEVTAPLIRDDRHDHPVPSAADRAIEALLRKPPAGAQRPEVERLAKLSRAELQNEVQSATNDAASYESEGRYAPERHAELYRRVNVLWDVRGLSAKQNQWLAQAVYALNEVAVRHAEQAMQKGDNDAVLRTAAGFGEWGYRLDDDAQEKRMTVVLRQAAASAR